MNCQACGHVEEDHRPPKSYNGAKSGLSSGHWTEVKVTAKSCCWTGGLCCSCTQFIDPGGCTCLFLFELGSHQNPNCPFKKEKHEEKASIR